MLLFIPNLQKPLSTPPTFWQKFGSPLRIAAGLISLMWLVQAVQSFFQVDLGMYGIFPRHVFGLRGIVFTPFLHDGWGHLISNTPPLFVTLVFLFGFYRKIAWQALLMMYLGTGILMWCFARSSFHVGASGVVYALVAFIAWTGIFRRNIRTIALALIVVVMYGPMLAGILPGKEGISWEGHLVGGLMGIYTAWFFHRSWDSDESPPTTPPTPEEPRQFLPSDIFDKTRAEREAEFYQRLREEEQRRNQGLQSGSPLWPSDHT